MGKKIEKEKNEIAEEFFRRNDPKNIIKIMLIIKILNFFSFQSEGNPIYTTFTIVSKFYIIIPTYLYSCYYIIFFNFKLMYPF